VERKKLLRTRGGELGWGVGNWGGGRGPGVGGGELGWGVGGGGGGGVTTGSSAL
jgi:hypothetical protein